jgi:spore germination cell wall hydrolase CwlJ-like protein
MLTLKGIVLGLLVASGDDGAGVNPDQFYCMTEAVYYEARGEGRAGMSAVAHNILNRTKSGKFPDSICAVTHQRMGKAKRYQYSYRNHMPRKIDLRKEGNRRALADSAWVALQAMQGNTKDQTHGALYYFNPKKSKPQWARSMLLTARINNHAFYIEPKVNAWAHSAKRSDGYFVLR